MEEGVVNRLLRGPLGSLFDDTLLITDVSGAGNNWLDSYCRDAIFSQVMPGEKKLDIQKGGTYRAVRPTKCIPSFVGCAVSGRTDTRYMGRCMPQKSLTLSCEPWKRVTRLK